MAIKFKRFTFDANRWHIVRGPIGAREIIGTVDAATNTVRFDRGRLDLSIGDVSGVLNAMNQIKAGGQPIDMIDAAT